MWNLVVQQKELKCAPGADAHVELQGDGCPGDADEGRSIAGYMRPGAASTDRENIKSVCEHTAS
jgi:hypothetical protein